MHASSNEPDAFTTEKLPNPSGLSVAANAGSGGRYARLLGRIEELPLGGLVKTIEPVAGRLTARPGMRSFFRGDATGTPVHSILTDAPFGTWWSAIFLDFYNDDSSRLAAKRLVAAGVITAVPTAVAGWAQWSMKDQGTKRVGLVHAAANGAAVLVYAASWAARESGRHELGVGLARAGALLLLVSGFLGGHLRSGEPRRVVKRPRSDI
ncbi:hypothetical protein PY310_03630 [Pseudarthrobacter sp. H3Y2-7]|uniref:DUF2231 domain-containing protein n=1 Tax=Pseudarthrobacter naphthalenicus TaxID=3031328 RepID=UPI0023B14A2C|nr:DUF2231 domain-containing protein [Pseudarthrobacter sp. H3Y2-7]MDE8667671.1 hypothetical protein [Pseudarthrobacter sp. H3Y2-7]